MPTTKAKANVQSLQEYRSLKEQTESGKKERRALPKKRAPRGLSMKIRWKYTPLHRRTLPNVLGLTDTMKVVGFRQDLEVFSETKNKYVLVPITETEPMTRKELLDEYHRAWKNRE